MSAIQLKTAINVSLQKSMTDTATANAATMLQDFAKTQDNIRQAQAVHPNLGKQIDIKA
ncbi:putative motility protein [Brevibacillus migulae]|uniref:putative motility protein n=1 Tax=Brevibacillus migulae TaxID=1644114 RepID=UPI00106EBA39|nr:putative motility protein [Brevibacillus migulae]